jgi:hypothetical protein
MRRPIPLLATAAAVALTAGLVLAGDEPRPAEQKPGPPPAGLVLEAKVTGHAEIQPGEGPDVTLFLRNESKDRSIPVVLPGDGSESGWREPHVFWTAAQVLPDGKERAIDPMPFGRCGNYDPEWAKDVVTLAAGDSRELRDWMPLLRMIFDFQEAGKVRLVAHYVWRAGAASKGNPIADAAGKQDPGAMRDTPPFELLSKPVEITVARPLDVVAEVKGKVRAGKAFAVEDVIAAKVVNRSGKAATFRPKEWTAYSEIDVRVVPAQWTDVKDVAAPEASIALAPDGAAAVFGAGACVPRQTMMLTFAKPGTARVAVRLVAGSAGAPTGPRIRSAWVDLVVEE